MQSFTRKFMMLFMMVLLASLIYAQEDSIRTYKQELSKQYGLDVSLYNGRYYYPETNIASGSPFWRKDSSLVGSIYMAENAFLDKHFMYNLYSQEFILIFNDRNFAKRYIILNTNEIDSVNVEGNLFVKNPFKSISNEFIQVIQKGKISCFLSWTVEKNFNTMGDKVGYHYLENKFEIYILLNSEPFRVKKQKDLLGLFNDQEKAELKEFSRLNKIRWRKLDVSQLKQLMEECEKVLE